MPITAYTPLLQVRTGLVEAKLIETPWLARLNYLSMVASKAARVVSAAREDGRERTVIEFGQRRAHPEAAVDAAYAAYLAGCTATSNLAATHRYGIPSVGTMDHFAVQAAERLGVPVGETERGFFATFSRLFPQASTLLVDTYDPWQGIGNAVAATAGRCNGVRLDSEVTVESVRRAKALLAELGAPQAQVFVSDGLDEWRVRELARAGADGFGVGENITCSPDAATGIGAVGKLVHNGYGKATMKVARGSGKATLPGMLQAHRYPDHDLLALLEETVPPGGQALLQPVWRGRGPVAAAPAIEESRAFVKEQIEGLPPHLRGLSTDHGTPWPLCISDGLFDLVTRLYRGAIAPVSSIEVHS
jgi:nicotinate phosphoribosyltransferase